MLRSISLATVAVITLTSASAAQAQTPQSDVVVRFADLDPGTSMGARALLRRIDRAATAACGDYTVSGAQREEREWRSCYRSAMENAVRRVNHPRLTALYAAPSSSQLARR